MKEIKEGTMKHLKWIVGLVALAVLPALAWAGMANAQQFRSNVDEGQTIHSSLYSSGKDIEIKGTVDGDVYCFGQTVTIDATVHGDVLCAAQDITINGKVDGNIRAAGQVVSVNAHVGHSATVAAMTFSLDADASVGQDLTATGDALNIKGFVGRDVVASGNTAIFNGIVGRNVRVSAQKVQLKTSAIIKGNLDYTSASKVEMNGLAAVKGTTTHATEQKRGGSNWLKDFSFMLYIFAVIGLTLVAIVLALFFPRFFTQTSDHIKNSFGKTLLVGLAASLLLPAICIGLLFSLAGIPLAAFIVLAGVFAGALSGPITGFYVGRLVLRNNKNAVLTALVGSAITVTVYFIPILGVLAIFVAFWLGFGALLLSLKQYTGQQQASAKK
jgi:cytoskeletal protein CcmA (bactofilin family)